MAWRIRRRRGTAQQVEEAAREAIELASGVATEALAEVTRRPGRMRRVGIGLVALAVLSAVATTLYIWWNRRREDEEFARLMEEPGHSWPPASPMPAPVHDVASNEPEPTPAVSSVPTPIVESMPVATPATAEATERSQSAQPVQAVSQPWAAPSAPSAPAVAPFGAPEGTSESGPQRPAWNNSPREVPLFVLPPRPNVPFRGAATPSVDRAHLPGSTSFIR